MTSFHDALAATLSDDFADLAGRLAETARSWAEMDRVGRWRAAFALRVALLDQARQFHDALAGWARLGLEPTVAQVAALEPRRWRLLVAAYEAGAASAGSAADRAADGLVGLLVSRLEEAARGA